MCFALLEMDTQQITQTDRCYVLNAIETPSGGFSAFSVYSLVLPALPASRHGPVMVRKTSSNSPSRRFTVCGTRRSEGLSAAHHVVACTHSRQATGGFLHQTRQDDVQSGSHQPQGSSQLFLSAAAICSELTFTEAKTVVLRLKYVTDANMIVGT